MKKIFSLETAWAAHFRARPLAARDSCDGRMKRIPLTQGKFALVDDEDYERVMQFKWHAQKINQSWYARRSISRGDGTHKIDSLHNFILGIRGVDHRDGDGLNNRRFNLRVASKLQNNRAHKRKKVGASSQYRGVRLHQCGRWVAQITVNYKSVYLGLFIDEAVAAHAYDRAAVKFFGEFAAPNFPA